jgi:DNA replication protein DnaC
LLDLSPFLKAIKSVSVTPIPWSPDEWVQHLTEEEREEARKAPRVRVASLPDGFEWLSVISPNLFIRDCYDQMWQEIEKAFTTRTCNRILILGNSGIGKTVSLNYILIRALKKGIRLLYETRLTRYYVDGNNVQSESVFAVNA